MAVRWTPACCHLPAGWSMPSRQQQWQGMRQHRQQRGRQGQLQGPGSRMSMPLRRQRPRRRAFSGPPRCSRRRSRQL